jgi:putative protease
MGIRRFRVTSLYGLDLLKEYQDIFIIASTPLPVCNSMAAKELERFGVNRVMAHIELEKEAVVALKEHSVLEVELYRLGRPGLLTTRAALPVEGPFRDNRGNGFEVRRDDRTGLSRIYPQKVVSVPRLEGIFDFYDLTNANWKNNETATFNFEFPLV